MTEELPELSLSEITDGGFVHTGRWDLNAEGMLIFAGNAPKHPGVYIFVQAGRARYVGVASRSLAQRLYMYSRPGISQRTNIRLNAALRDELAVGSIVDVYVANPPDLEWNGWKVSGAESRDHSQLPIALESARDDSNADFLGIDGTPTDQFGRKRGPLRIHGSRPKNDNRRPHSQLCREPVLRSGPGCWSVHC